MGTYSYFRLGIVDMEQNPVTGETKRALIQALFDDPDVDKFEAECAITLDGDCAGEGKWYNSNEELEKFCKKHPDYIFILGMELCAFETRDDEGEEFYLCNAKNCRWLEQEPAFMHVPRLFRRLAELQSSMSALDVGGSDVTFSIKCKTEEAAKFYKELLVTSNIKGAIDWNWIIGGFQIGYNVTIKVAREDINEFWSEAERVLVDPDWDMMMYDDYESEEE